MARLVLAHYHSNIKLEPINKFAGEGSVEIKPLDHDLRALAIDTFVDKFQELGPIVKKQVSVKLLVSQGLEEGKIAACLREKPGGAYSCDLPLSYWNSETIWRTLFQFCELNPRFPFTKESSGPHHSFVFVDTKQLTDYCGQVQPVMDKTASAPRSVGRPKGVGAYDYSGPLNEATQGLQSGEFKSNNDAAIRLAPEWWRKVGNASEEAFVRALRSRLSKVGD